MENSKNQLSEAEHKNMVGLARRGDVLVRKIDAFNHTKETVDDVLQGVVADINANCFPAAREEFDRIAAEIQNSTVWLLELDKQKDTKDRITNMVKALEWKPLDLSMLSNLLSILENLQKQDDEGTWSDAALIKECRSIRETLEGWRNATAENYNVNDKLTFESDKCQLLALAKLIEGHFQGMFENNDTLHQTHSYNSPAYIKECVRDILALARFIDRDIGEMQPIFARIQQQCGNIHEITDIFKSSIQRIVDKLEYELNTARKNSITIDADRVVIVPGASVWNSMKQFFSAKRNDAPGVQASVTAFSAISCWEDLLNEAVKVANIARDTNTAAEDALNSLQLAVQITQEQAREVADRQPAIIGLLPTLETAMSQPHVFAYFDGLNKSITGSGIRIHDIVSSFVSSVRQDAAEIAKVYISCQKIRKELKAETENLRLSTGKMEAFLAGRSVEAKDLINAITNIAQTALRIHVFQTLRQRCDEHGLGSKTATLLSELSEFLTQADLIHGDLKKHLFGDFQSRDHH